MVLLHCSTCCLLRYYCNNEWYLVEKVVSITLEHGVQKWGVAKGNNLKPSYPHSTGLFYRVVVGVSKIR